MEATEALEDMSLMAITSSIEDMEITWTMETRGIIATMTTRYHRDHGEQREH